MHSRAFVYSFSTQGNSGPLKEIKTQIVKEKISKEQLRVNYCRWSGINNKRKDS